MKKMFFLFLAGSLVVTACNNNKPKDEITITDKEGKEKVTINPGEIKDAAQDYQKTKEELEKLTPLTEDQLKALVPETLMGGTRTDMDMSNAMGALVVNADYTLNDSVKLKLEIVDCAGPAGSGLFGFQYLNMINVNSDDENEYVKTIEFKGGKAFENCKKKRNRCTLAWFSGSRYLLSLRGDNMGIDALKDAAGQLNIK